MWAGLYLKPRQHASEAYHHLVSERSTTWAASLRIIHCSISRRFYHTLGHYPGPHAHCCHGLVVESFRTSPQFDGIAHTRPTIHGECRLAAALPPHQKWGRIYF